MKRWWWKVRFAWYLRKATGWTWRQAWQATESNAECFYDDDEHWHPADAVHEEIIHREAD